MLSLIKTSAAEMQFKNGNQFKLSVSLYSGLEVQYRYKTHTHIHTHTTKSEKNHCHRLNKCWVNSTR